MNPVTTTIAKSNTDTTDNTDFVPGMGTTTSLQVGTPPGYSCTPDRCRYLDKQESYKLLDRNTIDNNNNSGYQMSGSGNEIGHTHSRYEYA